MYEDGPEEGPAEDDDFEGSRNWAVILVLAALVLLPIIGLIVLLL
ncbi:hypothetical protein [Rhizobium sp. RU36D]|nr:hypothetical protein [Rhizobium sp. RU36D]